LADTRTQFEQQIRGINALLLELSHQGSPTAAPVDDKVNRPISGKRILWVDDYPANNRYPRQILEEAGVRFDLALATSEAVELLEKRTYDLIISDMGRGSDHTAGLTLLRRLQEMKVTTPTVIFASGRAVAAHGNEAQQLGAVETLSSPSGLLRAVYQLLA
jgi:CheY-like chemotaxis protein